MTQDWQPIETAPLDGSEVLLWTDTRNDLDREYVETVCEGEHLARVQIGCWEGAVHTDWVDRDAGWLCPVIGQPTHWQPLPPPPVSA